jgi:hypothetical protein
MAALLGGHVSTRIGALRSATVLRHAIPSVLCAALLALTAPSVGAGDASTQSSSPFNDQGSNSNYRSYITRLTPNVPGLDLQVLEFADRLQLVNHTGETVTVFGYQRDPYARVLANGTVERNVRSPATYLNESFYGNVTPPKIADPTAAPKWEVIDRTGQFEWHDHRIHWPSPQLPPQVKDKSKRTLIFDWRLPIEVGSVQGTVTGQLFWVPDSSKAPLAVILLGVTIAAVGLLFMLFVRKRRGGGSGARPKPAKEAW